MQRKTRFFHALMLLPTLFLGNALALADGQITVYSARKDHLIKPLFDTYTEQTGIEIRYITDKAGPLLARLVAEGANTPADLLITVDAGNLWQAAERGVLAKLESERLRHNIPSHLRDPHDRWFGLSVRARTLVYSRERVKADELVSYQALAEPRWHGRLCLRTSKKVYNQSLVAMMIDRLGEQRTEQVVKGWVDNLAVPPFANDTKLMQAIVAGLCDVGIVNTYYFGRLQRQDPNIPLALFWPDQEQSGVHVNISGAGVTRHAKNPAQARKLLEWLSDVDAQRMLAALNMEYPVNAAVPPAPAVAAWGTFKADDSNLTRAGELQAKAVMLMDRAGYR
jgi:iron(III) transport system substrate-binding protein